MHTQVETILHDLWVMLSTLKRVTLSSAPQLYLPGSFICHPLGPLHKLLCMTWLNNVWQVLRAQEVLATAVTETILLGHLIKLS